MKNREEMANIEVKPQRKTRAERKRAKFAQRANEELQLCAAAYAFHNAYLAIQLECEEETLEILKDRLAELERERELEREKAATMKRTRRIVPKKETIEF